MGQELVWAVVGDSATAVSRAFAVKNDLKVLDEPVTDAAGDVRRATRANGRPRKPKTSVAQKAAEKKTGGGPSAPTNKE